jgi:retron-type reverse transcriptase
MPVRSGKAPRRNPDVHGVEKSDALVVPKKAANKDGHPSAELLEERGAAVGSAGHDRRDGGPQVPHHRPSIGLLGVRERAQRDSRCRFTALMHHLTPELLAESFWALKRHAAAGIDGVTWFDYENGLEERLADLRERVLSGRYRALPSKRARIPKPDGSQRLLGIASLEDKIVQRAVSTILSAIYEADFRNFSYGGRPGRGAHDALDALAVGLTERSIHWVLDADIRGFFDTIDHEWLLRFLEHRIGDQRILRLIRKWLRAGISDDGQWEPLDRGVPQGGVISPLLANIYLHYVLDWWADHWRKTLAVMCAKTMSHKSKECIPVSRVLRMAPKRCKEENDGYGYP